MPNGVPPDISYPQAVAGLAGALRSQGQPAATLTDHVRQLQQLYAPQGLTQVPVKPVAPSLADPSVRDAQIGQLTDMYREGALDQQQFSAALNQIVAATTAAGAPPPPDEIEFIQQLPRATVPSSPMIAAPPTDVSSRDRELAMLVGMLRGGELAEDEFMNRVNAMARSGREYGAPIAPERMRAMAAEHQAATTRRKEPTADEILKDIDARRGGSARQ